MEEFMADNAVDTPIATQDIDGGSAAATETEINVAKEQNADIVENTEVTGTDNAPAVAANSGDVPKTKAFSERLNKMVEESNNKLVSQLGFTNRFTGEQITTVEQLENFKRMHEAEQKGKDPIAYAEINGLKQKLQSFTVKEQDFELQQDPVYGEYYKELRDDVMSLVNSCSGKGIDIDLRAAFNTVMTNEANFKKITARIKEDAEKEAIRKVQSTANASVGSLGDTSANETTDIGSMSDTEFEALLKKVKSGETVNLSK